MWKDGKWYGHEPEDSTDIEHIALGIAVCVILLMFGAIGWFIYHTNKEIETRSATYKTQQDKITVKTNLPKVLPPPRIKVLEYRVIDKPYMYYTIIKDTETGAEFIVLRSQHDIRVPDLIQRIK